MAWKGIAPRSCFDLRLSQEHVRILSVLCTERQVSVESLQEKKLSDSARLYWHLEVLAKKGFIERVKVENISTVRCTELGIRCFEFIKLYLEDHRGDPPDGED